MLSLTKNTLLKSFLKVGFMTHPKILNDREFSCLCIMTSFSQCQKIFQSVKISHSSYAIIIKQNKP